MTDTATVKASDESFWLRVRTALGAMRPVRQEREPAYGQAAIARSIGMKPRLGARIEEELATGWANAAARHVSLSLLVIEMDRFSDYFTAYGKTSTDHCLADVMQTIADTLPRDGDVCLRLGRSTFVVVLADMPGLMARALASKMVEAIKDLGLAHKESHAGIVTISVGLAVTNPHGSVDKKFFEAGAAVLRKAQRKGFCRIETKDLRPAVERKRKAA
ncbi:diguanylate cyclase [Devosia sp. 2618]|uniref:diguanylate cyclase domain-containing protein n=1 Tax=Devosia sp. 2618 TaxID=3156454 RepID=UPI003391D403